VIVVSDTSPITSLLIIGRVEILKTLYGEVLIPRAVETELRRHHSEVPSFIRSVATSDSATVRLLELQLDKGEAEAIVLAEELKADFLLMDESFGRTIASERGLRVIGLVGVLLAAKRRGIVKSVTDILTELEQVAGFYISKEVRDDAAQKAGE